MRFAPHPPDEDKKKANPKDYARLGTHVQVLAAIAAERVDWVTLTWAGWPQLPYAQLKQLHDAERLPQTPLEELRKIKDKALRQDALKMRREADADRVREMQEVEME